jgi:SAM-dependent methyltransferase
VVPESVRGRIRGWVRATPAASAYTLASDEVSVLEQELELLSSEPWHSARGDRSTAGMTERVVEMPWVLSRYRGERRVLDVGTAWALPVYKSKLITLGIPDLNGVDFAARSVEGVRMAQADVRQLPYQDGSFELIICVSTLEHIGLDNAVYGTVGKRGEDGDVQALREFARVLAPAGRVLITVPFGRPDRLDFLKQYDQPQWDALLAKTDLRASEIAYYAYGDVRGWRQVRAPKLPKHGFQDKGAPAATGVLCAELVKGRGTAAL